MSDVRVYTVEIVQDGGMPPQWLRSHLDDLFGDDVNVYVDGWQGYDSDDIDWYCEDCGTEYSGEEYPYMTECEGCGGKAMLMTELL
jgi:DNA-directed RNA polymerase subunit RPC12/RpoP